MHRGEGRRGTKVHRGDGGCLNQATSNSAYERDPPHTCSKCTCSADALDRFDHLSR